MRRTVPLAPTSFGVVVALLLVCAVTALLFGSGLQQTDISFSPSSDGPPIVKSVAPVYPLIAQSAHIQGVVVVDFSVDVSGRVIDARIIRGVDLLNNAAIDAVRQWQFTPPATSSRMRATATFSLNYPSVFPRPSRFLQPRPSWVPDDFAFRYQYGCPKSVVDIDSLDHVVRNVGSAGAPVREVGFTFEGDIVADAFTALDRAGFSTASGKSLRNSWKEVSPVSRGIRQQGNDVFVTVAADSPPLPVVQPFTFEVFHAVAPPPKVQFGGTGPPRHFFHSIAVRQGDQWKEVGWIEPVDKRDEPSVAFSGAGKRIRALVRDALVPAAAAPVCL